jgi:hypothetical protein
VPLEWPAIPGHHGGVGDEAVKRPRVLCHVGLSSLLTDGGLRPGRGRVEDGWIRPNPRDRGVRTLSYPTSRVMANSARYGVYSDRFSPPSRDGQ